jgi:hypothetical protein
MDAGDGRGHATDWQSVRCILLVLKTKGKTMSEKPPEKKTHYLGEVKMNLSSSQSKPTTKKE